MNDTLPAPKLPPVGLTVLIAGLLVLSGCGDPEGAGLPRKVTTYPVKGQVKLADGKPLEKGTVYFDPADENGVAATGEITTNGSFAMKTAGSGDGVGEGTYKVRIESDATKPGPKNQPLLAVPPQFSDEDSSGIEVTVKPTENDLEPFVLKPTRTKTSGGSRRDD